MSPAPGLTDSVAIVTGGASGIGWATVEALAALGCRVAIFDRVPPSADMMASLPALADPVWFEVDVADEASIEAGFAAADARFGGRLDILVNSAGTARRHPATDLALADWEAVVAVNLTGVFLCCRAAARRMIPRGAGSVVTVGSIMSLSGGGLYPNISYQTTKGAVVNMTRALAVEWAPHGLRVNAVAPTYVRTPFIAPLLANPDLVARIEASTPLRRLAEPEEVAAAIVFLAGPGASMITGHTLPVDGGFLAQ